LDGHRGNVGVGPIALIRCSFHYCYMEGIGLIGPEDFLEHVRRELGGPRNFGYQGSAQSGQTIVVNAIGSQHASFGPSIQTGDIHAGGGQVIVGSDVVATLVRTGRTEIADGITQYERAIEQSALTAAESKPKP
jgi:hypothetical protein